MTRREIQARDYVAATAEFAPASYLTSKSTRDCRLSDRHSPKIRVKAPVGITGGYVRGVFPEGRKESKNARRKRQRYGK